MRTFGNLTPIFAGPTTASGLAFSPKKPDHSPIELGAHFNRRVMGTSMIRNVHRWWSVCAVFVLAIACPLPASGQEKAKKRQKKPPLPRPEVPAGAETVEPTATPP